MPFGTTVIDGGLDLITAPQAVKPGRLLACSNYEVSRVRGIRRMDGYEKYDGGASPSSVGTALLILGIQTSYPPFGMAVGDVCHLTDTGFGDIPGGIVSFVDGGTVGGLACVTVSVQLSVPLPYPVSSIVGTVGLAFYDDTTASSYNILTATAGFSPVGIGPPTALLLQAVAATLVTQPSYILPGTALGYRVSAFNANGQTFASIENTVTTPTTVTTTTTGFPTILLGTLYRITVGSTAGLVTYNSIYISDGTNSVLGPIGVIASGVIDLPMDSRTITTGNPLLIAIGSNVQLTYNIAMVWTAPSVPPNELPITSYGVYGRTASAEEFIESVDIGDGNTIPYYTDNGSITPSGDLPVVDTTGTNLTYIEDLATYYSTVAAQIQQVPGQGNVNGVFWLNDQLYATRDLFAVNFTAGTVEPNIGDTLYQGVSLGAATWQGQVAKIALTSGTWNTAATGNAAGVMMFYNVLGTIAASTAINNDTQSLAAIATAGTSGAGNATSTAAGMYLAAGGRGATLSTRSWQWCDLGWNVQYNNGVADFVDMNVALTQANKAANIQQYITTDWKVGTSGSVSGVNNGWLASGGAWPAVVAAQDDGLYVYHDYWVTSNAFPKSGILTLTGFGFTDTDIPSNAAISGIEIQFVSGAIGDPGDYTAAPIELTYELIGLASGQKFPLASSTAFTVTPSAPNGVDPIAANYDRYNWTTFTLGAPTATAGVPTSLLGYTSITPEDIKSSAFGIAYQVGLQGAQTTQKIQFGIDFIQIRFSYLPQTNGIYFWDGKSTSVTDGAMTAGSKTLTSATAAFTSADIGKTAVVAGGAGLAETVTDGVMSASSTGLTSATAAFTAAMVGEPITVGGAGAQVLTAANGVTTTGSRTLTSATIGFTAANVGMAVTIIGGTGGNNFSGMITGFTDTSHVTLNTSSGIVTGTGATIRVYGTLTTTIATYNSATSVALTATSTVAVTGSTVKIYGPLSATIMAILSGTQVTLSQAAAFTVSGATVTFYQPVLAQVVQHYQQGGDNSTSNAYGALYFQFIQPDGSVGGLPVREVGANEEIRTIPTNGRAPDGGANDGSTLLADTSTATALNVMDWSGLMQGQLQPDGTFAPASKYQSVTDNFYASTGLNAIYGVSGGGPAFYYDGVKTNASGATVPGNFSRILTGLPLQFETPRSVVSHQGLIILGYYSGLVQWGNNQNVLSFNPILDGQTAGNQGFGSRIMGMASINGDSLCVWTPNKVQMIQGNFNIPAGSQTTPSLYTSTIAPTSGGIEYTIQPMANYMYCDFRGITAIGATQKYGDFELGHYSSDIAPFIIPRVQLSSFFAGPNIGIMNSVLIRNKNMVRYFFADGTALSMTFLADNENPQFTIQNYVTGLGRQIEQPSGQPMTWDVVQAFTESLGRDRIFGATNDGTGWVYELERGNSFGGAAITAFATLVPDTAQAPYLNKEFKGINVFGQAQDYATFELSRSSDYVTPVQATGDNIINGVFGEPTAAPTGTVGAFLTYGTSGLMIEGTAINLRFDSSSNEQFPHVIQAVSYTIDELQEKQQ